MTTAEIHRRIALSDPAIDDSRNDLSWNPGLLYADRTPKFPLEAIHAATIGNPAAALPLVDTATGLPRAIPAADAEKQDT